MLDGSSPPVQTIIFENTNYKSSPIDVAVKSKYTSHIKNQRPEKCKGMHSKFLHQIDKFYLLLLGYMAHGLFLLSVASNDVKKLQNLLCSIFV